MGRLPDAAAAAAAGCFCRWICCRWRTVFTLHAATTSLSHPTPHPTPHSTPHSTPPRPSPQVLLPNSKPGYAGPEATPSAAEPATEPNPYFDEEETEEGHKPAAVAYRYRRFALPGDIKLVARTTVNAVVRKKASSGAGSSSSAAPAAPQYLTLATLNEWDAKAAGTPEWRRGVDSQRGNLLALEIKNNSHKLAKFTLNALLAGCESMRLGLLSRVTRADADNHVVLGVHAVQPATFATQLALSPNNAWGVLRWVIETVRKHAKNLREEDQPEDEYVAKFVLLRDPNKPSIYLYNVAPDAFEREDEEAAAAAGGMGGDESWGPAAAGGAGAEAAAEAGAGAGRKAAPVSSTADDDGVEEAEVIAKKPGAKGS
jgi:translation initiation factor 3 subunit D